MTVKRHIGIYAGTFDPIHSGHVAFAVQTLEQCQLDQVIILPEPRPRKKHAVTDLVHRIELAKRAIATVPHIDVARLSSEQFTIKQTLPELTSLFPDATFTFLFGSDIAKKLSNDWKDIDVLLRQAHLAIGMRSSDDETDVIASLTALEATYGVPVRYTLIYTPKTNVASSHIRQGYKEIAHIHEDVNEYIEKNNLYK
ncbi:nicotinate-nucleotide adenylyltransferase [soil metagenome]